MASTNKTPAPMDPVYEELLHKAYIEHGLRTGLFDSKPAADSHVASFGILAAASPEAASFALTPVAAKPVDPMLAMIAPFAKSYAYNFSGTGLSPAGGGLPAKISVTGIIAIDAQGAVTTFDTAHPGENRPGQSHPAWLGFRDFMVNVDPETGAQTAQLLAHWHADTGVVNPTGTPTPIGPWADIALSGNTDEMFADFTTPSGMYLSGWMKAQS